MNKIKINFVNKSPHESPKYASMYDSGMDLRAWIRKEDLTDDEDGIDENGTPYIKIKPLDRRMIHTGIYFDITEPGYEIQVRPKSGRAVKEGLSVVNTPGTIDNLYIGEICIIAVNLSNNFIILKDNEKCAQAVVCPVYHEGMVELEQVDGITKVTERGEGGFGHNGIK